MSSDLLLSGIGGSAATVALILVASRIKWQMRSAPALALTVQWLRLPWYRAAGVLAALATVSGLCFGMIADGIAARTSGSGSDKLSITADENTQETSLLDLSDAGQRALEKLRIYANAIHLKQITLAALNGNATTGANHDENPAAPLPDVDTMIARLAKRLESDPGNVDGWRTLGWSYLHTGKYAEAVKAYTTALTLDPQDADITSALEEARGKAATSLANGQMPSAPDPARTPISEPRSDETVHSPMVRGMVDRLASRLEISPHDADGWLKLMRARTVMGEMELAREALRRALAAFAEDKPTRERIISAAKDIGLSAY